MEALSTQHLAQRILQTVNQLILRLRAGDALVLLLALGASLGYFCDGKLYFKPDPNMHLMYEAPQRCGDFNSQTKKSRNIWEMLEKTGNDVVIFWASQSGVSERFAERLCREWHSRFSLKSIVADVDDYDPEYLADCPKGKFAVFLMSTYGEGDPPDNAIDFYRRLEKMREKRAKLDDLHYLAIGMGNKNYKFYNQVIKTVDETLSTLGAKRIGSVGLADEGAGTTEESFMDWKEEVLTDLGTIVTLKERHIKYEPAIEVIDICVDSEDVFLGELSKEELYSATEKVAYNAKNPYAAPIALSKTLSSVSNRVCTHMEVDLSAVPAMRYQTGDHLAVWPVNPENEVKRLIQLLGWDDDLKKRSIVIEAKANAPTSKPNFPSPTTRESLLKYYLEIGALTSRDFLVMLSNFAPNKAAKKALLRLGQSKEAFRNEVAAQYRSVAKVMELIEPNEKWSAVPFSLLVENFNRMQPRSYSISSSPLVQPRQPTITVVVNDRASEDQEVSKKETQFRGLATNFLLAHDRDFTARHQNLERLQAERQYSDEGGPKYDLEGPRRKLAGGKIYVHIKRSSFKLPTNPATPLVMVGAGTGVAPFRGFVQERAKLAELGKPVGKMVLLFGCRDDTSDFFYKDEWEHFEKVLVENFVMLPAFSRLQGHKKIYVQDALEQNKELVAGLVNEGAAFYVCGAATMAREVRARLVDVLAENSGKDKEAVDALIGGKMKKSGLYQEDVWG